MKVLIKAPMNVFTGYGNDGIGLTKALVKIGADVYIQPEEVKAPIPAEVAMLLTKEVVAPFDIVIHHVNPANFGAHPALKENAKLVLGWTMWEWCVDEGTEIFTKRGWLTWDQVKVGDYSLAIDPDTGKSSWQEISDLYIGPKMKRSLPKVNMGRGGGPLTTDNHRWLAKNSRGKYVWTDTQSMKSHHGIPRSVEREDLPLENTISDSLVEIVAWTYTEGWLEREKSVRIGQSGIVNPLKVDRIRNSLESEFGPSISRNSPRGGISWSESTRKDGMVIFSLSREASARVTELSPGKVPSNEFLLSLTQEQIDLFLKVSVLADGHKSRFEHQLMFTQNVGGRLDAFEFAATLGGYTVSKRYYHNAGKARLYITKKNRLYHPKAKRPTEFEREDYEGRVWCPTLTHHNWLARKDGRVFFTGNTNFDGHEDKDKFREQWKHYDALIGYDDVSVEALKEYFDGPVLKLQGGFEPDTWKKVERDWHSEDFYFCQLGVLTTRKDPFLTIQAFTELQHEDEEFKKHAKLMMKTSANSGFSHQIQDVYTNIRVFSDTWPQELIQKFYESAHVLLAPSRGEGKNVPALEFQTTGGAVIATDWAGHREWMHESFAYPLKYTLEPDDIYEPTVLCAKVDIEDYKRQMLHVFKNRSEVRDKAEIASQVIPRLCNWDAVVERLFLRIKDFLPGGTDIYSDYKSLGMEVNRGNGNTMPNWT